MDLTNGGVGDTGHLCTQCLVEQPSIESSRAVQTANRPDQPFPPLGPIDLNPVSVVLVVPSLR
jgi:hypothetical protein